MNTTEISTDIIRYSQNLIQDYMHTTSAPGVSIACKLGNEFDFSKQFGLANVLQEIKVTQKTKFRIASISKSLTAATIGLLYQEKKLDLDKPIQYYVPSFPL